MIGVLLPAAMQAAEALNATVIDMRWVKPIDEAALVELARTHDLFVTLEDHQRMTGAGSAVNEFVHTQELPVHVLNLGLPDQFVDHGKREALLQQLGLDAAGVEASIRARTQQLDLPVRNTAP